MPFLLRAALGLLLLFTLPMAAQTASHVVTLLTSGGNPGEIHFIGTDNVHYVGLKSPGAISTNKLWTLPTTDAAGPLVSNGSGILSFATDMMTTDTTQTISGVKTFGASTYYPGTAITVINSGAGLAYPALLVQNSVGGASGGYALAVAGGVLLNNLASSTGGQPLCTDSFGIVYRGGDCSSGSSSLPVVDTTAIIKNAADNTKQVKFGAARLTTGATRTLSAQDYDYTIAALDISQTFLNPQSFAGNVTHGGHIYTSLAGLADIGTLTNNWNNIFANGLYGSSLIIAPTTLGSPIPQYTSGWKWTFPSGLNAGMTLSDNAPSTLLTIQSGLLIPFIRRSTFDTDVFPASDNVRSLGNGAARWASAYVVNLTVSGTCTGCASSGVTYLNGLQGSLSLVAGTGISSISPVGSNITINVGGGSVAFDNVVAQSGFAPTFYGSGAMGTTGGYYGLISGSWTSGYTGTINTTVTHNLVVWGGIVISAY